MSRFMEAKEFDIRSFVTHLFRASFNVPNQLDPDGHRTPQLQSQVVEN